MKLLAVVPFLVAVGVGLGGLYVVVTSLGGSSTAATLAVVGALFAGAGLAGMPDR